MSNDCVQCREWELCPFHPKKSDHVYRHQDGHVIHGDEEACGARPERKCEYVPETERSEYVRDTSNHTACAVAYSLAVRYPLPEEAKRPKWRSLPDIPEASWLSVYVLGGSGSVRGVVLITSDCGQYMRTYWDGVLVDEETIECYQPIPLKPTR